MRVVIDATAAISGGKLYLNQLFPELAQLSASHEFIILHVGEFERLDLPQSQFQFRRVRLPFSGAGAGASIAKLLWRLCVLPFHLYRLKPQLFFSNAGSLPGMTPSSVKTVIALHNCMPLDEALIADERSLARRWRLRLLRWTMRRSLQRCDGSIVFSADTRTRIHASFGELPHTPDVVPHGIDWGAREREMPVPPTHIPPPYLLYVSQFHRYKNVVRLLEAFAELCQRHPQLTLVLVGEASDQSYWQEIQATMDRLEIRTRVTHIAACPREQLIALYRHALAFVQPSLAETFSFPLVEAMAMGLPIAAARAAALPEIAGDAAVYFDPHNSQEIAEVLDNLVWDERLRGELQQKAIAQAAHFSWQRTAQQTLDIFERVANLS